AHSKQAQLDAEKLFGIRANVFGQVLKLARGAVQLFVELRVYHELPDRALAGVHFIDGRIELRNQVIQPLIELVILEKFSSRALAGIEIRDESFQLVQNLRRVVEQRRVLQQLTR